MKFLQLFKKLKFSLFIPHERSITKSRISKYLDISATFNSIVMLVPSFFALIYVLLKVFKFWPVLCLFTSILSFYSKKSEIGNYSNF